MINFIPLVNHSIIITLFVFVMMIFTDYINVLTKGKMSQAVKGGRLRQYFVASFLGSTPGCLGAFMNVSFYIRGLLSFGAMVGGMIATSGDEAFVMLALFPKQALMLFGLLLGIGIVFGWISDKVADSLNIIPCEECKVLKIHELNECRCFDPSFLKNPRQFSLLRCSFTILITLIIVALLFGIVGPGEWNWKRIIIIISLSFTLFIVFTVPEHYLKEHIWEHILKKHLWRVFLWTFGALFVIEIGMNFWNLEAFVKGHMLWILLLSGLIAIIPESGPHLIFVMMFSKGLIPFSVLLTSSIVQDGHGILPLLSYSIKDSFLIKLFNLVIGLGLGAIFYAIGL